MNDERGTAVVQVSDEGAGPEELSELASKLRRQLLELDVDEVRAPAEGDAPEGARGVEAAAIGALIVHFIQSQKLLTSVIGTIQGWLGGRQNRSVKIQISGDTLEITGASTEAEQRLVDDWIRRHSNA